jgi:hypothetical protein
MLKGSYTDEASPLPAKLSSQQRRRLVIEFLRHSGTPPGRIRSRQPRERPRHSQRELPAQPRTISPLPAQPAIPTTQCSAFALPPAPRLRSPFSATPLPAASTPALRRALRALPTTPSTARGPLSSSTLLTLLVSGTGGREKALAVGE